MTGKPLSIRKAIFIGHLAVNVPVLVLMGGILAHGYMLKDFFFFIFGIPTSITLWLSLAIGFVLGWIWWSLSLPKWRKWSIQNGAEPESLHRWAKLTGLEWSKSSVFSKTEYKW